MTGTTSRLDVSFLHWRLHESSTGYAMQRAPLNSPAADRLVSRLRDALKPRSEILEAYLFGSRARGESHAGSDVDVAVYIDEAHVEHGSWGYPADLTSDLMNALNTNNVDVVVLNHAPPLVYHRVLRDGIRFLSRDLRATTTRAGMAMSRYFDFVPQMEKMDAARRYASRKDKD